MITISQPRRLCTQLDSEEDIKCHVLIVPLLWRKGSAVGRQLTVLASSFSVGPVIKVSHNSQTQHPLPLTPKAGLTGLPWFSHDIYHYLKSLCLSVSMAFPCSVSMFVSCPSPRPESDAIAKCGLWEVTVS